MYKYGFHPATAADATMRASFRHGPVSRGGWKNRTGRINRQHRRRG
jgi:hypothetical protein